MNRWHNITTVTLNGFNYDDFSSENSLIINGIDVPIKGNLNQMIMDVKSGMFDEIYMAIPMYGEARIREMTDKLADSSVPVFFVPDLFAFTLLQANMIRLLKILKNCSMCRAVVSGFGI